MSETTTEVPTSVTVELSLAELLGTAQALTLPVSIGQDALVPLYERLRVQSEELLAQHGQDALQVITDQQFEAERAEGQRLREEAKAVALSRYQAQTDGI